MRGKHQDRHDGFTCVWKGWDCWHDSERACMDTVPFPVPCWIIIPECFSARPTVTKKAGGGVWWKQSFALYGVNDKSVLIDNPPFFCFYLTRLAYPSLPTALWMDNTVWKRGIDVRKGWDWEEEKNWVISFSCGCLLDLWMILLEDLGPGQKPSWWSHSLKMNHWFSPIRKHWPISYGTYTTHIVQPDGHTTTVPFPSNARVM